MTWESYNYSSAEFKVHLSEHDATLTARLAAQLNISGITSIIVTPGEAGTLPITSSNADASESCAHFSNGDEQSFRSQLVGTGNVVQLSFAAPTDLGGLSGNVHFKQLLNNFIASDLSYSVAAWRDASTALFFVGYGPSTEDASSVFDVPACIRDTQTVECNSDHITGINNKTEYTDVLEARIAGPTYASVTCAIRLSGDMSVGPLGSFQDQKMECKWQRSRRTRAMRGG